MKPIPANDQTFIESLSDENALHYCNLVINSIRSFQDVIKDCDRESADLNDFHDKLIMVLDSAIDIIQFAKVGFRD